MIADRVVDTALSSGYAIANGMTILDPNWSDIRERRHGGACPADRCQPTLVPDQLRVGAALAGSHNIYNDRRIPPRFFD